MSHHKTQQHPSRTLVDQAIAPKPAAASLPTAFVNFDSLPDSAFVRIDVVAPLFACAVATVWRRIKTGQIPTPVKLSSRSTAWRVGDLRQALRALGEVSA